MSRRDGVPVSVFTLACALACAAYARLAASFRTKLAAAAAEKKRLQSILRVRDAPKVRGMFEPIAYARSAFSRRNGTPRQGGALVPRARCEIKVDSKLPRHLLQGLDAYSHAWVIYVFHANTNLAGTKTGGAAKGKVAVPRLDGERVGVLATRTPHRPVPVTWPCTCRALRKPCRMLPPTMTWWRQFTIFLVNALRPPPGLDCPRNTWRSTPG